MKYQHPKPTLGVMLRSTLFNALFYPGVAVYGLVMLPFLLTQPSTRWAMQLWVKIGLWLMRWILRLDYRLDIENSPLPQGGHIFACKHQSAWETLALWLVVPNGIFILKRDLFWLPVVGWWLWRSGNIGVIRKGGKATLRHMMAQSKKRLSEGANLIIFPQGTRVHPGVVKPYRHGVALLAQRTRCPIIPVALNAGYYWPRLSYFKYSGVIQISIMPTLNIPEEKPSTTDFLHHLEHAIETRYHSLSPPQGAD